MNTAGMSRVDYNTTEDEIAELVNELRIDESIIRQRIAKLSKGLANPNDLRSAAVMAMDQVAAEWANNRK